MTKPKDYLEVPDDEVIDDEPLDLLSYEDIEEDEEEDDDTKPVRRKYRPQAGPNHPFRQQNNFDYMMRKVRGAAGVSEHGMYETMTEKREKREEINKLMKEYESNGGKVTIIKGIKIIDRL